MGKKVAILNGSPHKHGNTSLLVDAFAEGARSAGNEVRELWLQGLGIHGCLGCYGGHSSREHPCTQHDGMDEVYPAVREAEVLVFASPLYFWTLSSQLRSATDRLFALAEGDGNLLSGQGRSVALLMVAGGTDFDAVPEYFDRLAKRMQWKNMGQVLAGGYNAAGDIKDAPELEQARDLGASI